LRPMLWLTLAEVSTSKELDTITFLWNFSYEYDTMAVRNEVRILLKELISLYELF
jgi:hypothetical protein